MPGAAYEKVGTANLPYRKCLFESNPMLLRLDMLAFDINPDGTLRNRRISVGALTLQKTLASARLIGHTCMHTA